LPHNIIKATDGVFGDRFR